jgi:hypothetical protein
MDLKLLLVTSLKLRKEIGNVKVPTSVYKPGTQGPIMVSQHSESLFGG